MDLSAAASSVEPSQSEHSEVQAHAQLETANVGAREAYNHRGQHGCSQGGLRVSRTGWRIPSDACNNPGAASIREMSWVTRLASVCAGMQTQHNTAERTGQT